MVLQLREYVKPFFWVTLGNGKSTSVWYDSWCSQCPLSRLLSPRDIIREGFSLQNYVADLMSNGEWAWPQSWLLKAPDLGLVSVSSLDESRQDIPQWCDANGKLSTFSVKNAWEALRPRGMEVGWFRTVWFSHCIPRHAFHLWLIMRNSLKTQDKLRQWDVSINSDLNLLRCSFCDAAPDSRGHLFFECSYSSQVWLHIRPLAGRGVNRIGLT
ncbi:putative reverse transcriptase domain-containing protein [Tanacetum coccineum]